VLIWENMQGKRAANGAGVQCRVYMGVNAMLLGHGRCKGWLLGACSGARDAQWIFLGGRQTVVKALDGCWARKR